mgnify:CR=1 FL=1
MATSAAQIAKTGKFGDLRRRLVFLLLALVVYRIGAHIPVPGIDPAQLQQLFNGQQGILNLFNMFSGGALSRFTVFALGIMPYISASIIMQLMTYVVPTFEQMKKEGEAGRRKITQFTRYGTLGLALFQSLGIAVALESSPGLVLDPGFGFRMTAVVSLTAGTMFLMWLGEQITERGLGNGISILIFAGIAAGLPSSIGGLLELVRTGATEAEYGRCHSSYLRFVDHLAACNRGELVQCRGIHALVEGHCIDTDPRSADLCDALRRRNHFLLFLLYSTCV